MGMCFLCIFFSFIQTASGTYDVPGAMTIISITADKKTMSRTLPIFHQLPHKPEESQTHEEMSVTQHRD